LAPLFRFLRAHAYEIFAPDPSLLPLSAYQSVDGRRKTTASPLHGLRIELTKTD